MPQPFGYKTAWIAFKTKNPQEVIDALHLKDIKESNWETGINVAYEGHDYVFVTPAIGEWVCAIGLALKGPSPDKEKNERFLHFLDLLKERISTFYYFCTYRVSEYHAWFMVEKASLKRGFAIMDGEIVYEVGKPTIHEKKLGFDFTKLYRENISDQRIQDLSHCDEDEDEDEDEWLPDEDDVINLAASLTFNTQELDSLITNPSLGWVGKLTC